MCRSLSHAHSGIASAGPPHGIAAVPADAGLIDQVEQALDPWRHLDDLDETAEGRKRIQVSRLAADADDRVHGEFVAARPVACDYFVVARRFRGDRPMVKAVAAARNHLAIGAPPGGGLPVGRALALAPAG